MRQLFLIVCVLFSNWLAGQSRVVLNNNIFMVIDDGASIVLDNANPNALSTIGTGGNIVSEDEGDIIKWNIGATTGSYTIPWTNSYGTKIPLSINKTSTGTGASADFILSTWETATDLNTPLPVGVNNMNSNGVDKSLFVADRFWHIDATSYTAKPDVTLTISYDPAANEIGGTNTITETNLLAQRFNTAVNHWESTNLYGTNDAVNDRVVNIVVPAADFYEDWILVDQTNPLPVTLSSLTAICEENKILIEWTTESEINNDYFILEKSFDAITFFELTTISGNGNSSVTNYYSYYDKQPSSTPAYYRLKQVDFDGEFAYSNIISSPVCNSIGNFNIYPNPAQDIVYLQFYGELASIKIFDNLGKVVREIEHYTSNTPINIEDFPSASYFVQVYSNNQIRASILIK